MNSILLFGFLLGLRHALESDHVAAVASLAARQSSFGGTVLQGAVWGLGHAVTLFVACSVVLFTNTLVPERMAHGLEALVGLMLILLGVDVLRRLWSERIRFHSRRDRGGTLHMLVHADQEDAMHDLSRHDHALGFPGRALGVGMMHGLAGSAALILLTVDQAGSPLEGLTYIALFGIGATLGMLALSAAIAIPLRWSARSLTGLHGALEAGIGALTITLGGLLLGQNAQAALALVF